MSSWGKVQLATTTLILDMGLSYENFLADGGDANAFHSPEELISLLEGNNPPDIRYLKRDA